MKRAHEKNLPCSPGTKPYHALLAPLTAFTCQEIPKALVPYFPTHQLPIPCHTPSQYPHTLACTYPSQSACTMEQQPESMSNPLSPPNLH